MLPDSEIADWWDAMTAVQRVGKAKELAVWNSNDAWSGAWRELSAANRQKLSAALAALVPELPPQQPK